MSSDTTATVDAYTTTKSYAQGAFNISLISFNVKIIITLFITTNPTASNLKWGLLALCSLNLLACVIMGWIILILAAHKLKITADSITDDETNDVSVICGCVKIHAVKLNRYVIYLSAISILLSLVIDIMDALRQKGNGVSGGSTNSTLTH